MIQQSAAEEKVRDRRPGVVRSDDLKWQMLEDYGECAYLKCLGYITVFACLSCLPHSFITLVFIINYTGLENQY